MKLRNHSDPEQSIDRTTGAFEIVTLDDTEELDPRLYETLPLELPTLDQQIEDVIAFGTRLDAMDAKGDDDGKQL
jgi:hypothetical protein